MFVVSSASFLCFEFVYYRRCQDLIRGSLGDDGKDKQITFSGRDEEPVLNPKGDWVYFVRSYEGMIAGEKYYPPKGAITNGVFTNLKEELWRVKTDGQEATLLFRSEHAALGAEDFDIATIGNIQFSPTGDKVYFESSEWATSDGLHVMNADGSDEKLLGAGNDIKIILYSDQGSEENNHYQGYIVTSKHRYFLFGGSYDWYYLFDPDMNEIGPLGVDMRSVTYVGSFKYTDGSEKEILQEIEIEH